MTEKRFAYGETIDYNFFDVFEEKKYLGMIQRDSTKIVDRLNEQQSIIEQLQEENKELKHWKKRIIEYLTDWFNKTEYLTVLYKINEINNEIGLDSDE